MLRFFNKVVNPDSNLVEGSLHVQYLLFNYFMECKASMFLYILIYCTCKKECMCQRRTHTQEIILSHPNGQRKMLINNKRALVHKVEFIKVCVFK